MSAIRFNLTLVSLVTASTVLSQYKPSVYNSSVKVNFIRTWDAKRPLTDPTTVSSNTNIAEVNQTTRYFDGIGRTFQTVNKNASPLQKDLVIAQEYDPYGREKYKFLPFVSSGADGKFKLDPFQQQEVFFDGLLIGQGQNYFYSQTNFEPSPLNRLDKELPPGDSWVGANRGVSESRELNVANEVRWWTVPSSSQAVPISTSFHGAGSLYRTIITDEQNRRIVEYRDKENHIILRKEERIAGAVVSSHDGWLCTYYLFDGFGNLRWVIQPAGVDKLVNVYNWVFDNTTLLTSVVAKEQCFYYEYDGRNRMIIKKVPGTNDIEEMVYDTRDRLIMSRTPNLKAQGYWLINKYDNFNRLTINALKLNSLTRASHQSSSDLDINYPTVVAGDIMQENYYNDYSWVNTQPGIGPTMYTTDITSNFFIVSPNTNTAPLYAQPITADYINVVGKQTGAKVRIFGTSTYLYSVIFYDDHGRVIQIREGNISNGADITTTQYDFSGRPIRLLHTQTKGGANTKWIRELTKLSYDHFGRVTLRTKKIGPSGVDKIIANNVYDELGQLKTKALGSNVETQNYDYNIRGWQLGVNRNFVKSTATNYFGYELGYDNPSTVISGSNYSNQQYDGKIGGLIWKSSGDNEVRKYDLVYDISNRITSADFNQLTGGSFNKTAGLDFSVNGIGYDFNGNITAITQKGWKMNASSIIDNLAYTYFANSNKLSKVTDAANDANTKLGDFKDGTNPADDYAYDANGNLTLDNNKAVSSILYTHINTPYEVNITGKGKITYTYDNLGRKWKKVIVDNTTSPATTTTWLFMNNFVYKNDTLQFFAHEEGRARFIQSQTAFEATQFNFDYFLKDHLGNTRMVLTEELQSDLYDALSLEGTSGSTQVIKQDAIWENKSGGPINVITSRISRPGAFGTQASNGDYAILARKSLGAIAAAKLLKVMSGDKIHTSVDYYYNVANSNNTGASGINSLVANFVSALTSSTQVTPLIKDAASLINSGLQTNTVLSTLLNTPNNVSGPNQAPKAYLNVLFFDEQFKFDNTASVVVPVAYLVNSKGTISKSGASAIQAKKNGYVYLYVSNESDEMVYFDNFLLTHERGPITEETHYYPFGLSMAGISSKAVGKIANNYKFNGNELQNKEFSDGSGLEEYDFNARTYNAQIGRFLQIDPLAILSTNQSVYSFASNDPLTRLDPGGMSDTIINGETVQRDPDLAKVTVYPRKTIERFFGGYFINDPLDKINYNLYSRRVRSGQPVLQENDRDSYYDNLLNYADRFEREQEAGEFEEEFLSIYFDALTLTVGGGKSAVFFRSARLAKFASRLARLKIARTAFKQFTKSTLRLGREMHAAYKVADVIPEIAVKEFRGIPGIRPDFVDFATQTIYELKPYNPRAMEQGMKQLAKYKEAFEQHFGGTWKTVLDTY
jgi:RHS repeat-associated protein